MGNRAETMESIINKLVKLDYCALTIVHAGAMALETYQRLEKQESQGQQEKEMSGEV